MKITRIIVATFLACSITSCATMDKSDCEQADWEIIGLEDGAAGKPLSYLGRHRKACAEYGIKPDLAQYRKGHDSGVRQFCTPQNGFDQGRAGRGYDDVCPADLEASFLAGFETGSELYQLSSGIERMHREVHDMQHELEALVEEQQLVETRLVSESLSTADRKNLLDRFKQLQSAIAGLEINIHDTELEAARKQGEFDVLSNSHGY